MPVKFPSIRDVLTLDDQTKIETFQEMWYQTFLWFLFSSFMVHAAASAGAFWALRKHKWGRFYPILILAMGVIGPITGGTITSAVIAGLFHTTKIEMYPLWALVCGWGQTLVVIFISFSRILATLWRPDQFYCDANEEMVNEHDPRLEPLCRDWWVEVL